MAGFTLREAFALYMQTSRLEDMAVRVDESPDIIGIGLRGGRIVPIVRPGSKIDTTELMERAGIRPHRKRHGGVNVLSSDISIVDVSRKKSPTKLQ